MRICFSARSSYGIVSPKIFRQMKKEIPDLEAGFVVDNEINKAKFLSKNPGTDVYCIASFVQKEWNKIDENELSLIESKYECSPIWQYIYTDRFLIKADYQYATKMTVALFRFFEQLFSENEYQFYYDETIATLQSYAAYLVGKEFNVTYIGQMNFRKAETTNHYFFTDPYQHMFGFDPDYVSKQFSKEIIAKAEDYLTRFESSTGTSAIMSYVKTKPKFEIKWIVYAMYLYINKEYHNPFDYMNYKYYRYFLERFFFYFKYRIEKKYYSNPNLKCKFVYYPLHYQPEASTIVCAQKYEKQLFFIDSIAKSLPADTKLYVKEHYALLGHRDVTFYKQLKMYPNVVMVDPFFSSMELIKKSQAVITLTGTAGWEAMLLRKPVILGGHIYFDNAPGIVFLEDVYLQLTEALENWVQPTREDIIKYLCECFSNVYDGSAYFAKTDFQSADNIEKVSHAFCNIIHSLT